MRSPALACAAQARIPRFLALPGAAHAQGRCGYGPRMPYMVISPYAKVNYVDHTVTDQTSTIRFIEDNWLGGERVGDGSFDAIAGSITSMFDWSNPHIKASTSLARPQRAQVAGDPRQEFRAIVSALSPRVNPFETGH